MAAPKGNQFWKFRTRSGPKKIFSDPAKLWEECVKYFQWCENNPLKEEKVFHAQGEITKTKVAKLRAMTLKGLWFYLKIGKNAWYNYKKDNDLKEVIREAEQVIYDQKFSGAAADLLNANIIARDLGLTDKKELDVTNRDADLTEEQIEKQIAVLQERLNEQEGR